MPPPRPIPPLPRELPPGLLAPSQIMRYLDELWANREAYAEYMYGAKTVRQLLDLGRADHPVRLTHEAARTLSEIRTHRDWRKAGASVISMNPDLMDELLGSTANFNDLPVSVFDTLPYPNPLLLFPKPLAVPLANGQQGEAFAAYVGGLNFTEGDPDGSAGYPTLTHAPNRNGLNVVLLSRVVDGQPGDVDFSTVSIASPRFRTLGEGVAKVFEHYGSDVMPVAGAAPAEARVTHIRTVMRIATMCLTYISATNNDVEALPSAPKGRKVPGNPTGRLTPPKWMQAGYVFGPKIGAARRTSNTAIPGGSGGSKRPHIRRLHHHLYWTGPGRTVPLVRLLFPIPVNGGDPGVATIHKADPVPASAV